MRPLLCASLFSLSLTNSSILLLRNSFTVVSTATLGFLHTPKNGSCLGLPQDSRKRLRLLKYPGLNSSRMVCLSIRTQPLLDYPYAACRALNSFPCADSFYQFCSFGRPRRIQQPYSFHIPLK